MKKKYIGFFIFFIVIGGCSWFSKNGTDAKTENVNSNVPVDTGPTARGGKLDLNSDEYSIREFDTNGDRKPDVFNVFKKVKNEKGEIEQVIFLKQMDLNHDGKIDVWRFYDEKGAVLKEELDLDFDGRIDQVDFYKNGAVVRKELDRHFDERTDVWKYYDEKGQLVRLEEDQTGDGNPDYWEYYNLNVITRIEKDTDRDGKPDVYKRAGDLNFTPIPKNEAFKIEDKKEASPKENVSADDEKIVDDADVAAEISSDSDMLNAVPEKTDSDNSK